MLLLTQDTKDRRLKVDGAGAAADTPNPARHVLHADFDAFYASVEQLDNPDLRGKPVVVGGRPDDRGVVAAASYEARKFGVRSAMPMRTAIQRCPQAIRVSPRFDRYQEISRTVMSMFREVTPLVEPLSLDEAYLDVTDAVAIDRQPGEIASDLKDRVMLQLGLTISIGVATSKSVAKIASEIEKPNGLTIVPPGKEREFLAPLAVDKLWGIGPKTAARLTAEGIRTISDLTSKPEGWLANRFGKMGEHLQSLAIGRDRSAVAVERIRKSASAETTLSQDTGDPDVLFGLVDRLSQRVARQLERSGLHGRTVRVKLRLADFTTFTRQSTLPRPEASAEVIADVASALMRRELHSDRLFRLVGVGMSGFDREDDDPETQPRFEGF